MKNKVKYPCRNCKYFKVCGQLTRTEPCNGRKLKNITILEVKDYGIFSRTYSSG